MTRLRNALHPSPRKRSTALPAVPVIAAMAIAGVTLSGGVAYAQAVQAPPATTTPQSTTPAATAEELANDPNSVDRRPATLALRSDSRLGSAESVYDEPSWPHRRNERVKLLGAHVALLNDEFGLRAAKSSFSSTAIADVSMYRLIYRLDRDPVRSRRHRDDVRASLTVGRTTFHDGYGWGPFLGPFTVETGPGRSHCFVKFFVLPNDPAFAPGRSFTGTLNFSRTRQRIRTTATIATGTLLAESAVDLDAAKSLGCPVRPAKGPLPESLGRPFGGISPASLVVPRERSSVDR